MTSEFIRHNVIRRVSGSHIDDVGVQLDYSPQNLVERNIDLPSPTPANNAIVANNCPHVKTFSNRKLDSTLLPGYKPLEGRHIEEWELETENMLML